jgi:hypothetical protein
MRATGVSWSGLNMIGHGVDEFVEAGPDKVLAGLNKKIVVSIPTLFALDPENLIALLQTTPAGEFKSLTKAFKSCKKQAPALLINTQ